MAPHDGERSFPADDQAHHELALNLGLLAGTARIDHLGVYRDADPVAAIEPPSSTPAEAHFAPPVDGRRFDREQGHPVRAPPENLTTWSTPMPIDWRSPGWATQCAFLMPVRFVTVAL